MICHIVRCGPSANPDGGGDMRNKSNVKLSVIAIAALAVAATNAAAQDYPTKAVRLVVPYAPGGSTDITARIIAPRIGAALGQQVIVDNRGGGASIPGTDAVVRAVPDGYTVLFGNLALAANPSLFRKLPYDAERVLAPVALAAIMPSLLVSHPSVPARNVKQLIAFAKTRPGELYYGSAGNGSVNHLAMEEFRWMAGIDVVHVPYKAGAVALTDVMGGQLSLMFPTMMMASPHVKAGRLVSLAISSAKRASVLPDVPTVAEAGVPGFEVNEWQIFMVPARTPAAIIDRLQVELVKAMQVPEAKERIRELGAEPVGSTPREAAAFLKNETARWARVWKEARIPTVD
jgi:tripartite-type tricarboxylate transporter receptor subunit TctC